MTLLGQPTLLVNLRKLGMNKYESSPGARSKMIPRIATHVYKVTQILFKVTELSLLAPSVRTMYNHCKNILL